MKISFKNSAAVAATGLFALSGFFLIAAAQTSNPAATLAPASSTDLQTQLQQKEQQLTAIGTQLTAAKTSLQQTQSERVTLQQQVKLLNGNISTLNLGIQADTLTTQQLQLQTQQLQGDMQDIASSINLKQSAIASTLQELQRNDATNGNLLALFLKNGTLADSVFEANTVLDLQGQLAGRRHHQRQRCARRAHGLRAVQQGVGNRQSVSDGFSRTGLC